MQLYSELISLMIFPKGILRPHIREIKNPQKFPQNITSLKIKERGQNTSNSPKKTSTQNLNCNIGSDIIKSKDFLTPFHFYSKKEHYLGENGDLSLPSPPFVPDI